MLSKGFWTLCLCRWREFRREPSAFFWVMFMPILAMVILGLSFSKPRSERYGIAVVSDPHSSAEFTTVRSALSQAKEFDVYTLQTSELHTPFKRGDIILAARIDQSGLHYIFDDANPMAQSAKRLANKYIQEAFGQKDPVASQDESINIRGGRYVDFLVPGLVALSIMTSSLFGIGMTIVANRRENLLKRYLVTPMRKSEFIASHMVGRLMVLAYELGTVLLAAYLIFHFMVLGNFLSFVFMASLGAAAFTAITLVLAARTRSIPAMGGMVNLISLPMMLFSGVFFAKSNFPDWMQSIINVLPLTALTDGLRKIALEAASPTDLWHETTILLCYLIAGSLLALKRFRWF